MKQSKPYEIPFTLFELTTSFDPFVACFNCIIQNVPGGSSGQFQEAQQLIGELESACQQDGSSVGSASLSSAS
jgi:hypothetical protein